MYSVGQVVTQVEQWIPRYLAPAQIANVSAHLFADKNIVLSKIEILSDLAVHLMLLRLAPLLLLLRIRCYGEGHGSPCTECRIGLTYTFTFILFVICIETKTNTAAAYYQCFVYVNGSRATTREPCVLKDALKKTAVVQCEGAHPRIHDFIPLSMSTGASLCPPFLSLSFQFIVFQQANFTV
jgi:hypothetical protein